VGHGSGRHDRLWPVAEHEESNSCVVLLILVEFSRQLHSLIVTIAADLVSEALEHCFLGILVVFVDNGRTLGNPFIGQKEHLLLQDGIGTENIVARNVVVLVNARLDATVLMHRYDINHISHRIRQLRMSHGRHVLGNENNARVSKHMDLSQLDNMVAQQCILLGGRTTVLEFETRNLYRKNEAVKGVKKYIELTKLTINNKKN